MSRRSFLRTSAVLASGLAALAASLSPLRDLDDYTSLDRFMQKYYKELTPQEMDRVLKRIANDVEREYGVRPHVRDLSRWTALSLSMRSISRAASAAANACTRACRRTINRAPRRSSISACSGCARLAGYREGEHNYAPESVPEKGYFYMPVQCQQCKNPPCVKVCPRPRHLAGDGRHHRR